MTKCDLNKILEKWNFEANYLGYEKMFKASVLVPLVVLENQIHILFQLRSANIRQGGEVSFPGGRVDSTDKDFASTALRETHEELGIDIEKIIIKGQLDTLVSPFNSIIEGYIGILDIESLEELNVNKDEVERVFTVPLNWFYKNEASIYTIHLENHPHEKDKDGNIIKTFPAKELGLPSTYHDSWMGSKRDVYLYEYENEKIWGFTALILRDALKKLKLLGIKG